MSDGVEKEGRDVKETVASAGFLWLRCPLTLLFWLFVFPCFHFFAVLMPLSSLRRHPTHVTTLVYSFGGSS